MARCRFVQPETVQLSLSEGYWIEVKKRLSVGERRDSMQAAAGSYDDKGRFTPNVAMLGLAQITAYLVDWNLTDANGKVVPITESEGAKMAAVRSLDRDTFNEIDRAIEKHIKAVEKEDAKRKNVQSGEVKSDSISPSAA